MTRDDSTRDDSTPALILEALRDRGLLDLLDAVCRRRNVAREEVCGRGRTRSVSRARHELWWELRRHPGMSFGEIGRLFARNHTTVMMGVRTFERARADAPVAA